MRAFIGPILILLGQSVCFAAVVPASPQMSKQCEDYLKKVQAPVAAVTLEQLKEFTTEPLTPKKADLLQKAKELMERKNAPLAKQPFWRTKPGLIEKMERDRQVLTSVTKSDAPNDEIKFDMKVAGLVNAPREFAFRTAQAFSRLPDVADNFKTVHYVPADNRLYLILSALGYQERMILDVYPVSGDGRDEIQFEVVWGNFKGMKGFIGYESYSLTKTEMSLIASYQSKTLPLPKILMGLALEMVTQKVAQKLRSFIESDYKQALKCGVM